MRPSPPQSKVSDTRPLSAFWKFLRTFSVVEPFLFLVTFAAYSRLVVSNELMLAKACSLVLDYGRDYCANITDDYQQAQVLRIGNTYNMAASLCITIPALLTGILVGAWGDSHGRKWPMVLVPVAMVIAVAGYALSVVYWEVSIAWLVVLHLPTGFCGGTPVINTGVYSYVSETSSAADRAARFSVLEMVNILAMTLGTTVGGLLFKSGGYLPVYGTSLVSLICTVVWLVVFMKEPKAAIDSNDQLAATKKCGLFSIDNIRSAVTCCVRKRGSGVRLRLWLLVLSCGFLRFSLIGPTSIDYYYAREKFGWGVTTFSYIFTAFRVGHAVAVAAFVPLAMRVLKPSDAVLGLIGVCSIVGEALGKALADRESTFFIGMTLGALGGTATVAVKKQISQLVPRDEIGRIFMLMCLCESLGNIGGTTAFSQTYNAALETFPGAPYLVSACLTIFPAAVLLWIYCASRSTAEMSLEHSPVEDLPVGVYRRRGSFECTDLRL